MNIDTADHVLHGPSGETWVVAYVRGDRLAWCGWPQGEAATADCTLLKKATPEERDKLLRDMADCGHDMRATYARDRLAACHEPPNAGGNRRMTAALSPAGVRVDRRVIRRTASADF